jgi:hypothetical protein
VLIWVWVLMEVSPGVYQTVRVGVGASLYSKTVVVISADEVVVGSTATVGLTCNEVV